MLTGTVDRRGGKPMSADGDLPRDRTGAATPGCPLGRREQTQNLLLYAANWGLMYLASPVTYVGLVQATLLKRLHFDDRTCNLPAGVYLWTTPLPVLVVWLFPQVRQLKPLLISALLIMA